MNTVKGTPVSEGIAIGKVFLKKSASEEITFVKIENKDEEKLRFNSARIRAVTQLEEIYREMLGSKGEQEAAIFSAHIEMLNDEEFITSVEGVLEEQDCNAEWAVKTVRDNLVGIFEAIADEYMRARAMDIKDISARVIQILRGNESGRLKISEPVIIVSHDLTPSDTAQLNPGLVLGIIIETGGTTSHTAILARMLGIPFAVYPGIVSLVEAGQMLAFDGETGMIEVEPDTSKLQEYTKKQQAYLLRKNKLQELRGMKSETTDGFEIILAGNISSPYDADRVLEQDGQGVGLFRTEFLYMNRNEAPGEEEQFLAYKLTVEKMQGKPVVIRTLDIGGDKNVDYLAIKEEENPFLGYRAIRLCLDRIPLWKVQIKALLRASVYGDLSIMLPMIVTMDELLSAKRIIEEVKSELKAEGVAFNEKMPVGMMMETPAAALMADVFSKEVDFFSIGTNDLIQYTMAVDRMNGKVAHLYSAYDPAVLRFVKVIADSAHQSGIWVGMCGEAAADKILLPLWIGLGLDELSMSPAAILEIKAQIKNMSREACGKLAEEILTLKTAGEIERALRQL